jgi:hypothetical protein
MKSKAGLHKKISSIFDGVPIPGSAAGTPAVSSDAAGLTGRGGGEPAVSGLASAEGVSGSLAVAMDTANAAPPVSATPHRSAGPGRKGWLKSFGGGARGSRKPPVGKIAMVTVLMIVFGLVLVMALRQPSASKAGQTPANPEKDPAAAKKAAEIPTWAMPEPYPAGLRDPMVLVEAPKPVEEETVIEVKKPDLFVIKGVVLGARGNTAIVGSEIVSVGDQVQGAKVTRIDRGEVEFEKDGQRWVQTVAP